MNNPNYYAILPANIRYDKNLKAMEKILYAEITALSNKNGYCSASNSYFAKLYGKSNETISRWISNLEKQGYLKVIIDTKKGNLRKIYPIDKKINTIDEKVNTPIDENINTLLTKKSRPIDEKIKQNNINTILQDSILQEENINKKTNLEEPNKLDQKGQTSLDERDKLDGTNGTNLTGQKGQTITKNTTKTTTENTTEYINKKTNKETFENFSISSALKKTDIEVLLNDLKVDEDFVYELDNHRKSINKPIVNIKALIATLKDIKEALAKTGKTPQELLTIMQEQGWKTIKYKWVSNLEGVSKKKTTSKGFNRGFDVERARAESLAFIEEMEELESKGGGLW